MERGTPGLDSTELADNAPASPLLRTRGGRFVLHGHEIDLISVGPVALYEGAEADNHALVDRLVELSTDRFTFRIRLETWAFCFSPELLAPWQRTESGYGLDRFDPVFWSQAADLARYAEERGVLVECVLFDAAALNARRGRTGWWQNPLNAACGGPVPERKAIAVYQQIGGESPLVKLALEAIRVFDARMNVTWELAASLDGADPIRLAFVQDLLARVRAADSLDRLVSVSLARPRRTDLAVYSLQGVDAVGFDWMDGGLAEQGFAETVADLKRFGKPVVNAWADLARDRAEVCERERFEAALAAGVTTTLGPERFESVPDWLKRALAEGKEGKPL